MLPAGKKIKKEMIACKKQQIFFKTFDDGKHVIEL